MSNAVQTFAGCPRGHVQKSIAYNAARQRICPRCGLKLTIDKPKQRDYKGTASR